VVDDVVKRRSPGFDVDGMRARLALLSALLVITSAAPTAVSARAIGGCPMFPGRSYWHADVSHLPVHPLSAEWLQTIGLDEVLRADFGSGTWNGSPIGIPTNIAPEGTPRYHVTFDYADESDQVRYPIVANPRIEGGGDRHLLTVESSTCRLMELYAVRRPNGRWRAGSGAVWNLRSNALRPDGWTSADAAGLPITPGLVRWNEARDGLIDHAIRFTVPDTRTHYIWPARHDAGASADPDLPPMGAWFRLRADVDISGYDGPVRAILEALKVHGMILADNGSPFYLSGVPGPHWDNDALRALMDFTGADFEAVDTSSLIESTDSGRVAAS
jgi:hypothetical protein